MNYKLKIFFLLFVIVVISCRKEWHQEVPESTNSFLTEAKDYYYSQLKISGKVSSKDQMNVQKEGDRQAMGTLKPLWYKNYTSTTSANQFLEVPIVNSQKRIVLYNFGKKAVNERINIARAKSSFQRLLIYKTKRKRFHQVLLTYVPDYDYLEKSKFSGSSNQINKMDANFNGYILFTSIKTGKNIQLLQFENGKMIKKRYPRNTKNLTAPNKKAGFAKNGSQTLDWQEQCDPVFVTPCITVGDPETEYCQEPIQVGEDCYDVWVDEPEEPEEPGDPCEEPEYFWMCNPENPDPEDPEEPEETNDPNDPCDKAKQMQADTVQKTQLNDLKSKTTQNYEAGYYKTVGNTPLYSQGVPNTLSWDPPQLDALASNSLESISHSHYAATNSLSIFSGDDLDAFAKYVKSGKTTANFTYSVVTSQGTSYTLMVDDISKFNSFYNTWINASGESTTLKTVLHSIYVKPTNSSAVNEANFLNFLQSNNSGMSILKANSGFSKWKPITRDSNGNVTFDPCN